jgi:comF family protein
MVFKLKYSAKTYMAKIIGEIMADSLLESHQDLVARMDIITFVPLNKKRLESRGFNQAEKIGAYLAALIGLPMVSLVERVKNTDKLHGLSSQERRRMLKNSFKLKEEAKDLVYGKNILIVDDIFTTGATVDEISKVLRLAGAQELVSLTFLTGKYEKDIDK